MVGEKRFGPKKRRHPSFFQARISSNDGETEGREVFVEAKADRIPENRPDRHEGNGIAKGEPLVLAEYAKNVFCLVTDRVIVINDVKSRFDLIKKPDSSFRAKPVKEKGDSLADHVPCRVKGDLLSLCLCKNFSCPFIVRILWAEGGKEKGRITKGSMIREFYHGSFEE